MRKAIWTIAILLSLSFAGTSMAADGSMLYKRCAGCHGKAGEGTPMAPLKLAGSDFVKDDAAAVKNVLTSGKSAAGKRHPKANFSDAEFEAIVSYLKSL